MLLLPNHHRGRFFILYQMGVQVTPSQHNSGITIFIPSRDHVNRIVCWLASPPERGLGRDESGPHKLKPQRCRDPLPQPLYDTCPKHNKSAFKISRNSLQNMALLMYDSGREPWLPNNAGGIQIPSLPQTVRFWRWINFLKHQFYQR